ncbi:MAG TPA: ABC transporter permease [Solirubrobacterales bacterium]|nr:ABC transporter permease [Solirubrobacterales bacterium]
MEILRNIGRRKLRSILTISGITIGILALTTMGSMAANFNALLDGGVKYYQSSIQVSPDNASFGSVISTADVDLIKQVPGVANAFAAISLDAKPGQISVINFGIPDTIVTHNPLSNPYQTLKTTIAQGRDLTVDSRGEVVLGYSMAREFNKKPGDTIDLPVRPSDAKPDFVNHPFTVVGLLDRTRTAPDNFAEISLADGQMLLADSLPSALKGKVDTSTIATGIEAYAKPGVNADALADKITADVPGVKAIKPSVLVNGFKAGGAVFTAITTGAALLALIIGGLAVINTMLMAVTERIREIGLKKAVGAHTRDILLEVLAESTAIGLIGGVIGFGMGATFVSIADASTPPSQSPLFLITPGLAILSLGFAIALGALAGIAPALRAARLDPVAALRTA